MPDGKQYVNSFCLFCPDAYDDKLHLALKIFIGRDEEKVIQEFSNNLNQLFDYIVENMNRYPWPVLDPEEQQCHDKATQCKICNGIFSPDNPKCRHHNHYTGEYVGPVCRRCNLAENNKNFKLRIVFHNLNGYDGYFIVRLALQCFQVAPD
jgi:hypothetical protein